MLPSWYFLSYKLTEDATIVISVKKSNDYTAQVVYDVKDTVVDVEKKVYGIESITNVDFTSIVPGKFVSQLGVLSDNSSYGTLSLSLSKNEEIHVYTYSSSGYVSVVADGSTSPYNPLVIADADSFKEYVYKADMDKQITISVKKSNDYGAKIIKYVNKNDTENEDVYDIIVFMGQSNMAGRGVVNENHPQDAPTVINGVGYEFRAINDPTKLYSITKLFGITENKSGGINDGHDKSGGMVPSFVNAYYKVTKTPIIGVSASMGGTRSSQWLPSGDLLPDAIQRFEDCVTFCQQNDLAINHKYAIWCQGEADGDHSVSAETYNENFGSICDTLFTAGIEKIFVCRIGEYNGSSGSIDYSTIINAQTAYCKSTPDVIMATTTLASCKARGMMKDDWHYYQDAYNEMGEYAGINVGIYQRTGKEPTMYDSKNNDLYYSYKN